MKFSKSLLVALSIAALALSGCQKTKKVFGMTKNPPNEFTVMQRAPLEVPPDYNLRPPQPGVKRPQEAARKKADVKAREAVLSKKRSLTRASVSKSESHLLTKVGANKADQNIRAKMDTEAYVEAHKHDDKNWLRKNLPFYKAPKDRNLIDPHKEAERLKEKQSANNTN